MNSGWKQPNFHPHRVRSTLRAVCLIARDCNRAAEPDDRDRVQRPVGYSLSPPRRRAQNDPMTQESRWRLVLCRVVRSTRSLLIARTIKRSLFARRFAKRAECAADHESSKYVGCTYVRSNGLTRILRHQFCTRIINEI